MDFYVQTHHSPRRLAMSPVYNPPHLACVQARNSPRPLAPSLTPNPSHLACFLCRHETPHARLVSNY